MSKPPLRKEIEFNRPKKFKTVRRLGHGACGETILIHDDDMDIDLVVKKYCPQESLDLIPSSDEFRELMDRFKEEARILFQLNHPNIVRVYNFYDYKEFNTGYIVMEYVPGTDIESYIADHPLSFDAVFEKTIGGFEHLESKGVLHRDIRPMNLLVTDSGEPKIIDFGFGKLTTVAQTDASKSITLNWWCETPPEFSQSIYDAQTEVYFVGKLFERVINSNSLNGSKHAQIIAKMCMPSRATRFKSFREIYNALNKELFDTLQFDSDEIVVYRQFAAALASIFSDMDTDVTYERDIVVIVDRLNTLYNNVMLEEYLPSPAALSRIFVRGSYRYRPQQKVDVHTIKNFINLLTGLSRQKGEIVLANIFSRLDALARVRPSYNLDDEIPF